MLHRLILMLIFLGGGYLSFRWLKSKSQKLLKDLVKIPLGIRSRPLKDIQQWGHTSNNIKKALELRTKIREAAEKRSDRNQLFKRVDAAIERIGEQEKVRGRIQEALAQAQDDESVEEDIQAFEQKQIMLSRLKDQAHTLGKASDRAIFELSKIHLALLDVSAAESVLESGVLGDALADLETQGVSARSQAEAEAEVEQFIHRQRQSQNIGG